MKVSQLVYCVLAGICIALALYGLISMRHEDKWSNFTVIEEK